jgi:hypothetical protein
MKGNILLQILPKCRRAELKMIGITPDFENRTGTHFTGI